MDARRNFENGLSKLNENAKTYNDFLNLAGRFYKHPISVIISLYGHGEVNSTLVANAQVWDKIGNPIKSDAIPISVASNLKQECVYTFEETIQKYRPEQWTLSKDSAKYIINDYNTKNNTHWKNFNGVLSRYALKNSKSILQDIANDFNISNDEYKQFSESFAKNVAKIVGSRCAMNGKFKNTTISDDYAFKFAKDSKSQVKFIIYAMKCARLTLQEIETHINQYSALENERRIENDKSSRKIRSEMVGVHDRESSRRIYDNGGKSSTSINSNASRQGGLGTQGHTGGAIRKEISSPNGIYRNEQIPQHTQNDNRTSNSEASGIENKIKKGVINGQLSFDDFFVEKMIINAHENNESKIEKKNFIIADDNLGTGKNSEKLHRNISAIKLLKILETENRNATPEEQEILSKYVGWGGLADIFDKENLANERAELENILTREEYISASASVNNAHYTQPIVIEAMYNAIERIGISENASILEPAMGVGNFFGKLPESMRNCQLYGIELDSISGRISQKLYPNADIQIKGFEKTNFNDNTFDLCIGNVPFGNYNLHDSNYKKDFLIHDHFFRKALDKIVTGGIVAFITSKGTLDKRSAEVREKLAEKADLIGAIRLPNTAFKANAGTEVTSDIIFLQKRAVSPKKSPDWCYIGEKDGVEMNQYFIDNPHMILGKMENVIGRFGEETTCIPYENADFKELLSEAILHIKANVMLKEREKHIEKSINIIKADEYTRPYTYTVSNDDVYYRDTDEYLKPVQNLENNQLEQIKSYCNLRLALRTIIDSQTDNCSDSELEQLQKVLSQKYDAYILKYGNINDKKADKLLGIDDDYNMVCSLEDFNKETKSYEKSDIFSKRTIRPIIEITHCDTVEEAYQISLDRKGKVDIEFLSSLTEKEKYAVISDLQSQNLIFRDPIQVKDNDEFSGYVDASEYLSGNIREKLFSAEFAVKNNPEYQRNIEALKAVMPVKIGAEDINAQIGAGWIENKEYSNFLAHLGLNKSGRDIVIRSAVDGSYKVENSGIRQFWGSNAENSTVEWGTSKCNAFKIFENLLNHRDIKIYEQITDTTGKKTRVLNREATLEAKAKADSIKTEWKNWFWEDKIRRDKYEEIYNNAFNSIIGRKYDGTHQTFPNMSSDIELRQHQKDAIARAKYGGNTLLAHTVGAGKSFEIIASVMEKKHLDIINKACVVVPKALVGQMAKEWQRLYPNARILATGEKDFTSDNRQKFMSRCVTGNYDAVIMSYEQFGKIQMSTEYRQSFLEDELKRLRNILENGEDPMSRKQIEQHIKRHEAKIEKLLDGGQSKDRSLDFEQYGFDCLVVDEAHNYKNGLVVTRMNNVAGVTTTPADKSEDMLMKCQYLNDKSNYKNIIFASGTPVSNSMTELYVMQNYLRPDLLYKSNLDNFDDWASNFGETVTQLELKPSGDGFQMKTRFAKFNNLPELMAMYREFADIKTEKDLDLPIPKLAINDGERKANIVKIKPDEWQKSYVQELGKRAEKLKNGGIDPKVDNMLKITHEARLLGLDPRCVDPNAEFNPNGKIATLINNVIDIYHKTDEERGVQAVFCDIAVNSTDGKFSAYEEIKRQLIENGVSNEEIIFAGEANTDIKRAKMMTELQNGDKRIVIASTQKLGTGANIQNRLAAVHHLDIPYRPSDIEQRNGRILRQGNKYDEVNIFHYLTEDTFDAYLMQIISNKQKFIGQLMNGDTSVRSCEDLDGRAMNYAEMQALCSGDLRVKEKIQGEIRLQELKSLESAFNRRKYQYQNSISLVPKQIDTAKENLEKAKIDMQKVVSSEFNMTIKGKVYSEHKDANEAIYAEILKNKFNNEVQEIIGEYSGYQIALKNVALNGMQIILKGELDYCIDAGEFQNSQNWQRIHNLAEKGASSRAEKLEIHINDLQECLEIAKEKVDIQFEFADELKSLNTKMSELEQYFATKDDVIAESVESTQIDNVSKQGIRK